MTNSEDQHPHTTPTPEDIIAEAQRRVEGTYDVPEWQRGLTERLNRGVYWLARHWLALFNALAGLYTAGAIAPPFLMQAGLGGMAKAFYAFYKPFCHQYPFRSWFLFGSQFAYPLKDTISVVDMNEASSFIGNATLGYKMALCQRDIALYGMIFLAGLIYSILRKRRDVPPLPLWCYFVFGVMPMMLDGGIQWLSYLIWVLFPGVLNEPFETIPLMRALTGALFGAGVVAVAYPYFNEYFAEVRMAIQKRFGWS